MNPLEIASTASPKRTDSLTAAPSFTSSTSFQGLSPQEDSNLSLQNVQDTIGSEDFSLLVNNKPGLLTLTEDSWSCCIESQGAERFYVHLKFQKKERLKKLASYFPTIDLSFKRISPEEEPPKPLQGSILSRKIVETHLEYQRIKKREQEGLTNGKLFFQGILNKQDFNSLLTSFSILLCLNKSSWSLKINKNSFVVKLSFHEELMRDVAPVQIFGEKLANLLTQVEAFDVPKNHNSLEDELQSKIQESYQLYLDKNAKTIRQGKKDNDTVLDEESANQREKENFSHAQNLSASLQKPFQQPPESPLKAQEVETPKIVKFELLSDFISRANKTNSQQPNKTLHPNFSLSRSENRSHEKPSFTEKIRPSEDLKKFDPYGGDVERVKPEKGVSMKAEANIKSLFSTAENVSHKTSKVDVVPQRFEMFQSFEDLNQTFVQPRFGEPVLQRPKEETKKDQILEFFKGQNEFTSSKKTSEQPLKYQGMEIFKGQGLGSLTEIAKKATSQEHSNKCLFSTTSQNSPALPQTDQKVRVLSLADLVNQSETLPFPQQNPQNIPAFTPDFLNNMPQRAQGPEKLEKTNPLPNACLFTTPDDRSNQPQNMPEKAQEVQTPKIFNLELLTNLVDEIREMSLTGNIPSQSVAGLGVIPEEDETEDLSEKDIKRNPFSRKEPSQKVKLLMKELAEEVEFQKILNEISEDFKKIKASDDFEYLPRPKEMFFINWRHSELQTWWDCLPIEDKRRMWGVFFTEGTTEYWEGQPKAQIKGPNPKKRKHDEISQATDNNADHQETYQSHMIEETNFTIASGEGTTLQQQAAPEKQNIGGEERTE